MTDQRKVLVDEPDFGAFVPGAHHIETYSGGYLDLANPDPLDVRLADVAHGLAQTCRFAGQSRRFYSVAEHAVLVQSRLRALGATPRVQMAGLHHDDPEAYIGDVTRPLKALLPGYRELEDRVWAAIQDGLCLGDLPWNDSAVKDADDWALSAESYYLLGSRGATWFCAGFFDPDQPTVPWVLDLGVTATRAKRLWLERHAELTTFIEDATHAA